jgi:hypothetical protein
VNLTFFAPLLSWQRPPFWICFNSPKAATDYGGYSYNVSWSFMKRIKKKSTFFVSMATAAKFVQPIPICLAYLVPLDVDVVPIKFHKFLFASNLLWSLLCFSIF